MLLRFAPLTSRLVPSRAYWQALEITSAWTPLLNSRHAVVVLLLVLDKIVLLSRVFGTLPATLASARVSQTKQVFWDKCSQRAFISRLLCFWLQAIDRRQVLPQALNTIVREIVHPAFKSCLRALPIGVLIELNEHSIRYMITLFGHLIR